MRKSCPRKTRKNTEGAVNLPCLSVFSVGDKGEWCMQRIMSESQTFTNPPDVEPMLSVSFPRP